MLRLRGLWLACLTVLLVPATASALTNWTRTVWSDGELQSFEYDSEEFELVDLDPTTDDLEQPRVIENVIQTDETSVIGAVYQFVIPNFFDPLPTKLVDVRFVGFNPGAGLFEQAGVLDIIGSDSPFDEPGPSFPVFFDLVERTVTPDGNQMVVVENWIGGPNPDFETVKLFVPVGFELGSIEIVTQSVPEPSALGLLGAGIAGLTVMGRRRAA